jgi:de-etiolated-1
MVNARVLAAYDSASEDLLSMYENHCDTLRYPAASPESPLSCVTRFASSPSTNIYARQAHERFKQTIAGARYGGRAEAVRRVLAQLPISAQSYSTSPYLDLALYSYDDKWVSAMERPKACGDHPIRYAYWCGEYGRLW